MPPLMFNRNYMVFLVLTSVKNRLRLALYLPYKLKPMQSVHLHPRDDAMTALEGLDPGSVKIAVNSHNWFPSLSYKHPASYSCPCMTKSIGNLPNQEASLSRH